MFRAALFLSLLVGAAACKSSSHGTASPAKSPPTCREGVGDDVRMAGRTAGSAVAVGLVEGGTQEAGERWHEKGNETKSTARAGGAETSKEASLPPCK